MHDLDGRNLIVEEGAWKATNAMLHMDTSGFSVQSLTQITLEGGRAVLVGVDLKGW